MTSKGRLAARSDATRAALVSAARELFAHRGYAATTVEDIVRSAGMTRGALYHHFDGKEQMFTVVYELIEAELAARSLDAAQRGSDPLDMLERGLVAFLDACLDPAVQRIVLLDALSVLGWEEWHRIGTRYNFALMRAGLEAAVAAGLIPSRPIEPLAHVLQGAVIQAGMAIARAGDSQISRDHFAAEIGALLHALRLPA